MNFARGCFKKNQKSSSRHLVELQRRLTRLRCARRSEHLPRRSPPRLAYQSEQRGGGELFTRRRLCSVKIVRGEQRTLKTRRAKRLRKTKSDEPFGQRYRFSVCQCKKTQPGRFPRSPPPLEECIKKNTTRSGTRATARVDCEILLIKWKKDECVRMRFPLFLETHFHTTKKLMGRADYSTTPTELPPRCHRRYWG